MNDGDVLLMLDRLRQAVLESAGRTDDLLVALADRMQVATTVTVPAPPAPQMAPAPAPEIVIPDFSIALRAVLSEVAAASERTDNSLEVLIERFEMLAEKMTQSKPVMAVGGRSGLDQDIHRTLLTRVAEGVELAGIQRIERYAALTGSNEIRYFGRADIGTADSDAAWTIQRYDHDADGIIEIVKVVDSVWDDRATLF